MEERSKGKDTTIGHWEIAGIYSPKPLPTYPNGFPKEVLEKLQKGEGVFEEGKHIGIENCLKRFHYYYDESGEIRFENSPLGGAVVDIHIPYCAKGSK